MAERPGEGFYLAIGLFNFALGITMTLSIFLTVTNYSFYPFPGGCYFYTQHLLFENVDAFEVLGVFTAAIGCVIIAFKKRPPQIGKFQIVGSSILMVLAAPLTFIPVQIWIDKYVFYSPLLASLDLRKIYPNFPLNFNLFTYTSLIIFMVGMLFFLRVSKLKTVVIIGFLVYLYFYPSLRFTIQNIYNFPALTPSIPLPVYAGFVLVLAVTAIPVVSQCSISGPIRGMFKPSVKTAVLLIIAASLLTTIFMGNMIAANASQPVTHRGLSPNDKIDPYLLTLDPVPPSVPVILKFDNPISDENKTSLNDSGFFNISNVYEDRWVSYFAIHGSINTTGIDFQQTLRNLVNDYPLCYILYNRNPSNPPDIGNYYSYYYYVGADILENFNITGRGTTIAIVDSGITDDYGEIKGKMEGRVVYQVNFLKGREGDPLVVGDVTPEDSIKHGTWTACIVAGSKGIAPEANIIDLKVKAENGELNYMTYIYTTEAVYWCIRNKNRFNISVIVLPIGCRDQLYGSLTEAVDRAFLNGMVVITGGGAMDLTKSSIIGGLMTPGIADWAITVAATNDYIGDCWSPLSPLGPSPHWYFPKPELTTAYKYTSTASSVVAGVALLLVQQYDKAGLPQVLRSAVIRWALISGAQEYDLGPPGWDIQYGFGRVNALTSYLFLKNHLTL
ncbi:MAG: S8 family serine peptidase [Candidatus Lokiarchaeia archaeon]